MPWKEVSIMSSREEFVVLAQAPGANIRQLCRRFGISSRTAYKWLARYAQAGADGLQDRSRRPHRSPRQTPPAVEAHVRAVRIAHPTWGGRKIHHYLCARGVEGVPSASTITAIVRRQGLLPAEAQAVPTAWRRFEADAPNHLWQMDFKSPLRLPGGVCSPLTVLDDHSRYALGLQACADQTGPTVQTQLIQLFTRYGLPYAFLVDNGTPWCGQQPASLSTLSVWLMQIGIRVYHARPYHPQTLGTDERFHRTLQADLLRYAAFRDIAHTQRAFDRWRTDYNTQRPHEALAMAVPADRYRVSARPFISADPPIEYGPDDQVRKVQAKGEFHFQGRTFGLSQTLKGKPIALRATDPDGVYEVFFCHKKLAQLDLTQTPKQTHCVLTIQ